MALEFPRSHTIPFDRRSPHSATKQHSAKRKNSGLMPVRRDHRFHHGQLLVWQVAREFSEVVRVSRRRFIMRFAVGARAIETRQVRPQAPEFRRPQIDARSGGQAKLSLRTHRPAAHWRTPVGPRHCEDKAGAGNDPLPHGPGQTDARPW